MSPGSNGTSAGPASPGPIPGEAMLHSVLLLPEAEDRLSRFLHALPLRTGSLLPDLTPGTWTALDLPRPCSWCDFESNGWTFRLVFDPQGIPPALMGTVASGSPSPECLEALEEHKACCLVFLLAAPRGVQPWERFLHLATIIWAWIDAGATLLCLPEAQLLVPRRVMLGLEPDDLSPEHGYLFLSNGLAEVQQQGEERKLWLRTWGLGQFGLPDLAAALPSRPGEEAALEAEMESLRLLFETLPPAMIKEQGILPVGGTVKVGQRTWTAVGEPGAVDYPFLRSRCGVQLFV